MCLTPITLVKPYRNINNPTQDACNIVPCGKCILCLKRRQNSWAFRLTQESKQSKSAIFLTLTYENTPLSFNGNSTLSKTDYQKFTKRLRSKIKTNKPLKYYACGEYGTQSQRPHYHSIIFNLPFEWTKNATYLQETWGLGHIDVSPCNTATISYVTKYLLKGNFEPQNELDDRTPEFSLMSKKLGLSHLTPQMQKYYQQNLNNFVTLENGTKTALPRYFREKIFTKKQIKKFNSESQENRDQYFKTSFNNSFKQELEWKKQQISQANKKAKIERSKI